MYSNHLNSALLTALLAAHDVPDAVVCPGSRNGAVVHDFYEQADALQLYPATDERSAAFLALGISLRTRRPTAVCVTSGSALLNTLPAVAEAYYRHVPLLVISADRPARLIGQLDGQTLPQRGALQPYAETFDVPEPRTEADARFATLQLNAALLALRRFGGQPVHINLPLEAPLFEFGRTELPVPRVVEEVAPCAENPLPRHVVERLCGCEMPLLVMGQYDPGVSKAVQQIEASDSMLVLPELIANQYGSWRMAALAEEPLLEGDYVAVHAGGNLIGKQVKDMLRAFSGLEVIRLEPGLALPDTFGHLTCIVRGPTENALQQLADELPPSEAVAGTKESLEAQRAAWEAEAEAGFTEAGAMRLVAAAVERHPVGSLHLGNSLAVRHAALCFEGGRFPVFCNRGVNGIEGSVSTAAGYALKTDATVLLCLGDLSFFYDSNGLWNTRLGGNLRIVVFNNGGGKIFQTLPGLADSPARDEYVAASHGATAEGICRSYDAAYLSADTAADAADALERLLTVQAERPVVLELFF